MPYVNDNGVKLWYRVSGSGEPLVLSGGFGLLHNQFDYVLEALAKEFQVIDWNYRGAGESDRAWVGGYTLDRWVDDLELILAHLNVRQATLWGTSTGAPLSIRYAARYPQRVKNLIVYPSFKAGVASRKMFQIFQDITEVFGYNDGGNSTLPTALSPEQNSADQRRRRHLLHDREAARNRAGGNEVYQEFVEGIGAKGGRRRMERGQGERGVGRNNSGPVSDKFKTRSESVPDTGMTDPRGVLHLSRTCLKLALDLP